MTKEELYALVALELQRNNPDQYAQIAKKIGYKEPTLYDARQMTPIRDRFCQYVKISPDAFLSRRWSRLTQNHRRVLLAFLIELYAPTLLLTPFTQRGAVPRKLVRPISQAIGADPSNIGRLIKEARAFYQTYSEFRQQVENVLESIKV